MNFLAHAWVAGACGMGAPESVLGSVLPDLAAMAGVRLEVSLLPERVARGVDLHLRSDSAFHGHATFLAGSRDLRERLLRLGVDSGPARAVGHAGWELLLDGTLAGEVPVTDAMTGALDIADAAHPALDPSHRARWDTFVASMSRLIWDEYTTGAGVAHRLSQRLATRPRLQIPERHRQIVETALEDSRGEIVIVGPVVLDDVAASVSLTGPRPFAS